MLHMGEPLNMLNVKRKTQETTYFYDSVSMKHLKKGRPVKTDWHLGQEMETEINRHDLILVTKVFQNYFMVIVVQFGKFTKNL